MEEGSSKGNSGKLFECQNSGCRQTFKYSSQLSRHKKICTKQPPNKKSLKWCRIGMCVFPAQKVMHTGQI